MRTKVSKIDHQPERELLERAWLEKDEQTNERELLQHVVDKFKVEDIASIRFSQRPQVAPDDDPHLVAPILVVVALLRLDMSCPSGVVVCVTAEQPLAAADLEERRTRSPHKERNDQRHT